MHAYYYYYRDVPLYPTRLQSLVSYFWQPDEDVREPFRGLHGRHERN